MKTLISILFLSIMQVAISQTEARTGTSFNFEGQVSLTTNGKALWYNMGGPCVKFNFSKIAFGISMLPSLKFEQDAPRPTVVPILGVGPQFYFLRNKRFILSVPFYYIASRNSWELSGGIGYVLTRPKK